MTITPHATNTTDILEGRARRRIAVAGFSVFATAAFTVPLVFATGTGASPSAPHHHTSSTVCSSTTTTLGATTTTVAETTTTIADTTTTEAPTTTTEDTTTTTEAVTTTSDQGLGAQGGIVQLGSPSGGSPVTLPVEAEAAAATQLPRTGSSSLPAAIGGVVLLVTGALAATAKRRRHLGRAIDAITPETNS